MCVEIRAKRVEGLRNDMECAECDEMDCVRVKDAAPIDLSEGAH